MYRFLILAIVALLATGPAPVSAQTAPAPAAPPIGPAVPSGNDMLPIVLGVGAIAGVVVFNVLALGVEALPGGLAYAGGATVPAEMSVAMSRVYATTSAVIGALVANYVYTKQ